MGEDFGELREALRDMPVPEPRPYFEDRVLSRASAAGTAAARATAREPLREGARGWRATLARPLTWMAAATGALAASLVWLVLMRFDGDSVPAANIELALHENRDISLVIDSERALEGAVIKLYSTGSIALVGYEDQAEIQWVTTLNRGANLLTLPVVARARGDGAIVAEIEHEGRTRRVNVSMQVRG